MLFNDRQANIDVTWFLFYLTAVNMQGSLEDAYVNDACFNMPQHSIAEDAPLDYYGVSLAGSNIVVMGAVR